MASSKIVVSASSDVVLEGTGSISFSKGTEKICETVYSVTSTSRYITFNSFTMGIKYAQASLLHSVYGIARVWQVYNLDEMGFSPGRDVATTQTNLVVTDGNRPVFVPKFNFLYTNRIFVLVCIKTNGSHLSAAVVKGVLELRLSDGVSSKLVFS